MDAFLTAADNALRTLFAQPRASEQTPAHGVPEASLDPAQKKLAGALMRVNHVGEVCAQALYSAQAAVTRDPALPLMRHESASSADTAVSVRGGWAHGIHGGGDFFLRHAFLFLLGLFVSSMEKNGWRHTLIAQDDIYVCRFDRA